MNPTTFPAFDLKTWTENLNAGREAWQGGMKLFADTLLQTSQANLDLALSLREQYGRLWGQALERSQAAFGQEQAMLTQWNQALQGQSQSQMALFNKLSAEAMEAGRGFQKQAQAAGTQMAEMLSQATESAMASVEGIAAPANGTGRSRAAR